MKKTLFLAVLAGAALAGCVKNEPIPAMGDGSPEGITFAAPVVTTPTRATEILGNYPKGNDFAVYAIYHDKEFSSSNSTVNGTSYMSNVRCVAHQTDETTYCWQPDGNAYYWPKNGYLTFAGYAPAKQTSYGEGNVDPWGEAEVGWNAATGFTFTNFKVNDDPTKQIDLLYSDRVYNQTQSTMVKDSPYNGVTIKFKHALSSILFKAKAEGNYAGTEIRLKSIKINNVINKGTFTQGLTNNYTEDSQAETAWTFDETSVDYYKAGGYTVYEAPTEGDDKDGILLNATIEQCVNGEVGNTPTQEVADKPITNDDGTRRSDLILIPQPLNTEGHQVSVTIIYTIKSGTGGPVENTSEFRLAVKNPDENAPANQINLFEWEMGKRYIYHISIGLQQIYFNPQVTNWDDEEGVVIDPTTTAA